MTYPIEALPGKVVTLRDHLAIHSHGEIGGYAETGMKARVISATMDDESIVLRLDLEAFRPHNITVESADWNTSSGDPATATDLGKVKKQEDLYIMPEDLEAAVDIQDANNPALKAYMARADQSQSYPAFLEGLVTRAIDELGFDPASPAQRRGPES